MPRQLCTTQTEKAQQDIKSFSALAACFRETILTYNSLFNSRMGHNDDKEKLICQNKPVGVIAHARSTVYPQPRLLF